MRPIRVLVTDDSAVIRRLVCSVIDAEPDMMVVGTAENGSIALERARELRPDVMTLDVEMPVMNGLEALAVVRRRHPSIPVVMFSTLTVSGGTATLEALSLGAADFVTKPSGTDGLRTAMARIASSSSRSSANLHYRRADHSARRHRYPRRRVSQGDPPRRSNASSSRSPPVVRVRSKQSCRSSRPSYRSRCSSYSTCRRYSRVCSRNGSIGWQASGSVRPLTATSLSPVTSTSRPANIISSSGVPGLTRCSLSTTAPPEHSCRPSADVLFRSAVETWSGDVLGVVMTGMGADGSGGARAIVDAGGRVVIQDQATSVVWGMPGAVARAGLADRELALSAIAGEIIRSADARRSLAPETRLSKGAR